MLSGMLHKIESQLNTALVFWLRVVLVLLSVFMVLPAMAVSEKNSSGQWTQYKSEDGIIVYERSMLKHKYREARVETIMDAPIEVLVEVLIDIPSYPQWMHKCEEAIPLEQEGEFKRVLYYAQGSPFGSSDRDVVIEAITTADWGKGAWVTTLNSIDNHPYKHSQKEGDGDRQRMVKFKGTWSLQMIERNRTKVIYTAYTNPGGFAPGFIVNSFIRKICFQTLKAMIPKAKEKKYIEAAEKGNIKRQLEKALSKREERLSSHYHLLH